MGDLWSFGSAESFGLCSVFQLFCVYVVKSRKFNDLSGVDEEIRVRSVTALPLAASGLYCLR